MKHINILSVEDIQNKDFITLPFYKDDEPLQNNFRWGMTLRKAGSMRFRWNEKNFHRDEVLKSMLLKTGNPDKKIISLELIHSKIVYDLVTGTETDNKTGDGMISNNRNFVPVVTVADCVPIYFCDPTTGAFGVVHSGWKGTGIIGEALKMAEEKYGVKPENVSCAIGPHIGQCCYSVDDERAKYFIDNFGENTIKVENGKNLLSLTQANLNVLMKAGVKACNIVVSDDCTACNEVFGSFRREASALPDSATKMQAFTVQAAFIV